VRLTAPQRNTQGGAGRGQAPIRRRQSLAAPELPAIVIEAGVTNVHVGIGPDDTIQIIDQQLDELRHVGFVTFADDELALLPGSAINLGPDGALLDITAPPGALSHVPDGCWVYTWRPLP
jgi:hypothetical protein